MFDPTAPENLDEAAALGRRADGVVVDVSRLLGHRSVETALLEGLLSGAPDAELVALLTEVELLPLNAEEAATVAQAWERVGRWVIARQHQAFIRVSGLGESADPGRSDHVDLGTEEARIALGLSSGQADRRALLSRELATRLPKAAAALEAGEISPGHVSALVDLTKDRTAEIVRQVEERVLVRAPHQTVAAFKRCVRRALIRFDPLGEALAHLQAAGQRDVIRYDDPDSGLCTLVTTLPVVDGLIVWNALDANARRDRARDKAGHGKAQPDSSTDPSEDVPGPVAPLGAYRADTLLRWAQEDLAHEGAPRPQRRPIEVQVVIDVQTLLALRDNPAEIPGHGPLPAPIARLLAEDAQWRRLVTDPINGHLLDYGHTVYEPPQALRDYVVARDRVCIAPHCERASQHGQLDHLDAFPRLHGRPAPRAGPSDDRSPPRGRTSANNVRPECTWHHLLKTHHGWDVRSRPDGSVLWTSPGGRAYLVAPRAALPQ